MAIQINRYNPDNKYYVIVEVTSVANKDHPTYSPKYAVETDYLVFDFTHLPAESEILEKVESNDTFDLRLNATFRLESVKVTGYTIIAPMERKEIIYR